MPALPCDRPAAARMRLSSARTRASVLALAIVACTVLRPSTTRERVPGAPEAIAFMHVSVVDVTSGSPRPDRTVIVRGNRIVVESSSASVMIPTDAHVVDGRGKYLIPGLWDMHVHTAVPGGREVL